MKCNIKTNVIGKRKKEVAREKGKTPAKSAQTKRKEVNPLHNEERTKKMKIQIIEDQKETVFNGVECEDSGERDPERKDTVLHQWNLKETPEKKKEEVKCKETLVERKDEARDTTTQTGSKPLRQSSILKCLKSLSTRKKEVK